MNLKIAKYKDLKQIPVKENGDSFCFVNKYDNSIKEKYFSPEMSNFFNGKMIVRNTVAKKLAKINKRLKKMHPNYILIVNYGYRSLKIQEKYFKKELEIEKKKKNYQQIINLYEIVHKRIAVPEVAGHPSGGAVDLTIFDNKKNTEIDMGSIIADFNDINLATYSQGLTSEQIKNRKILHDLMVSEQFCPFYEEWWHFSYGDREWAYFYNRRNAIYGQKSIKDITITK